MDYCNGGYNGMVYHHSQQHNHEYRYKAAMMKIGYNNNNYNNVYGHNQHISWNGMPPHHPSSSSSSSHNHHNHPAAQYGNRNVPANGMHYDSYKGNMVQNCYQSTYTGNFESPYESTAMPTAPTPYRSRFGGYQMCDTQQCFPVNSDNGRADYMSPLNNGVGGVPAISSRCIDPLSSNSSISTASDPRNSHQPTQQPPPPPPSLPSSSASLPSFMHDSGTHHSHMRMPPHSSHRVYDSHPKTRPFGQQPQQQQQHHHHHHPHHHPSSWPYGNQATLPTHNNSSETINESNHPNHHYYQYHHAMNNNNNSNYNDYPHHINANGNQYAAGAPNGQLVKEDKPSKMHRDRSLSKLVAMNRRLETQMNETERIEQQQHPLHHEPFENFDYYTDYSETPDSITSTSQYTNNDCMMNNGDTDNNNNVNGATNNGQKSNCKEGGNQAATNESEWQQQTTSTSAAAAATASSTPQITTATASPSAATTVATAAAAAAVLSPSPTSTAASPSTATDTIQTETQTNATDSNTAPTIPIDGNLIKKNDPPSVNTTIKSPAKQNTNKKVVKSKKANSVGAKGHSVEKRRKRKEKKSNTDFSEIRELKTDTIPLPAFSAAFGSTEIGRFSEIFFNVSGSPIEIGLFESEADTLSPQPWEMGDSLEGPHFSMQANSNNNNNNTPLSYAESLGSTDSPTASNASYFSDLRASEF